MISDQVCRMSGAYAGVINVNVAQGYYYVVQSDGPGLSTFGVTVTAAPANDDFANATPYTWAISASYSNGETYGASYNVDVNGATVQPGEPPTIGQRTVWYSTTIPNAGQITFNNQDSIYTGDGTMAGLRELFGAGQGTGQLMVAAGENLWVQASGSGTAYITPGPHSMQLIVQPYNDAIANAINITNYVPVTPANWNGQQVYMYTFQAPAGFWTLASDGHYIRNWYCVHATTNLLNVTVSQPDSASGYYDFGAGLGTGPSAPGAPLITAWNPRCCTRTLRMFSPAGTSSVRTPPVSCAVTSVPGANWSIRRGTSRRYRMLLSMDFHLECSVSSASASRSPSGIRTVPGPVRRRVPRARMWVCSSRVRNCPPKGHPEPTMLSTIMPRSRAPRTAVCSIPIQGLLSHSISGMPSGSSGLGKRMGLTSTPPMPAVWRRPSSRTISFSVSLSPFHHQRTNGRAAAGGS